VLLAAARNFGKINCRIHVARSIGGWRCRLTLYSPHLVDDHQNFSIEGQEHGSGLFPSAEAAAEVGYKEKDELLKQHHKAIARRKP